MNNDFNLRAKICYKMPENSFDDFSGPEPTDDRIPKITRDKLPRHESPNKNWLPDHGIEKRITTSVDYVEDNGHDSAIDDEEKDPTYDPKNPDTHPTFVDVIIDRPKKTKKPPLKIVSPTPPSTPLSGATLPSSPPSFSQSTPLSGATPSPVPAPNIVGVQLMTPKGTTTQTLHLTPLSLANFNDLMSKRNDTNN